MPASEPPDRHTPFDPYRTEDGRGAPLSSDSRQRAEFVPPDAPVSRLGKYELIACIGRGGMGEVFKARDTQLERIVALKILKTSEGVNLDRLLGEARIMARLSDHYNVVTVFEAAPIDGKLCIAMQHVDGGSAADLLRRGPLEPRRAHQVIEQTGRALKHAGQKQVVHRDIKPSNLLITSDDVVKVVDFGLAKEVRLEDDLSTMTLCGTPAYMAPEQWSGRSVDWRADQYSLGATYFQLATGRLPFEGGIHTQRSMHLEASPPPAHEVNPALPPAVSAIIARMMAKDPSQRYPSWDELIHAVRLVQNPPTEKRSTTPTTTAPKPTTLPGRRHARRSFLVGAVSALFTWLLWAAGVFDKLELLSLDQRFAWGAPDAQPSQVMIVAIDQASKSKLAPDQPLSRAEHLGEALRRLSSAAVVGVDLLVTEPSVSDEDGELASATSGTATIHAINLPLQGDALARDGWKPPPASWSLPIASESWPKATRADLPIARIINAMTSPAKQGSAPSSFAGHVTFIDDLDGVIRRVPHVIEWQGRPYPSLSLAAVSKWAGASPREIFLSKEGALAIARADKPSLRVPLDRHGQMLIDYTPREIPRLSLLTVLEGDLDEIHKQTRGKIVFIGSQLDGDYDVDDVPVYRQVPLVTAHALAADTMVRQRFVERPPWPWELVGVLALPVIAALTTGMLPSTWGMSSALAAVGAYLALSMAAFNAETRWVLPVAAPLLGATGAFVTSATLRYRGEDQDRRRLAIMLGRYISPRVLRRMLSEPHERIFEGRRKELSIVSFEIRDFDRICQQLEPEETIDLLRPLFESLTRVVFQNDGVIDHFTGEGLQAFFGDPEPQPDHALRAVRCALEMRSAAADVIRQWTRAGRPALQAGLGVATGYATVGNIGSWQRLEYRALGHVVEQSAELASQAKGQILIAARTNALIEGQVDSTRLSENRGNLHAYEVVSLRLPG